MAEPPEDIINLFDRYSDNGAMTAELFSRFFAEVQREEKSFDEVQKIISHLNRFHVFPRRGLDLNAFFQYLLSDQNPPVSTDVHHDMDAPLAHYFMYTGHNSYLTGNQLSSDCSVEPIIKALRQGVRVIELDLWPNSTEDDVQVLHGGTMTSPVKLIKCLEAIKENAFISSKYPVIITFEDHLNSSLQEKVAKMVTSTFGYMLCTGVDQFLELPSPESLINKILISTKPPKEYVDDPNEAENPEKVINDSTFKSESTMINHGESENRNMSETEMQNEMYEEDEETTPPKYINLIAIHQMKHKGSLENLLTGSCSKASRLSLSEQKLESAVKNNYGSDIIRFTQRNLLRIYPKGSRILSSNYDPLIGWTHGAQMVAFNMQGHGKHLWVMRGMFRANGGCGYVKKPDILLSAASPYSESFDPSKRGQIKKTLKVKVFMGDGWHLDFRRTHFDRFSPPDFFIKLQILGVPADKKKVHTKAIEDQWIPTWNQEFDFPLTVSELAILRVQAVEYDMTRKHDFGGQTCLPVSELRSGIRSVPLYDYKGEKYENVKLLMHFHFT